MQQRAIDHARDIQFLQKKSAVESDSRAARAELDRLSTRTSRPRSKRRNKNAHAPVSSRTPSVRTTKRRLNQWDRDVNRGAPYLEKIAYPVRFEIAKTPEEIAAQAPFLQSIALLPDGEPKFALGFVLENLGSRAFLPLDVQNKEIASLHLHNLAEENLRVALQALPDNVRCFRALYEAETGEIKYEKGLGITVLKIHVLPDDLDGFTAKFPNLKSFSVGGKAYVRDDGVWRNP